MITPVQQAWGQGAPVSQKTERIVVFVCFFSKVNRRVISCLSQSSTNRSLACHGAPNVEGDGGQRWAGDEAGGMNQQSNTSMGQAEAGKGCATGREVGASSSGRLLQKCPAGMRRPQQAHQCCPPHRRNGWQVNLRCSGQEGATQWEHGRWSKKESKNIAKERDKEG